MRRAMLSNPPLNEMDELALDHTAEESVLSNEDLCCKRIFHTFHSPPETGNVLFYSLTRENQERDINFTHLKVGTTTGNFFFFLPKITFYCVCSHTPSCVCTLVCRGTHAEAREQLVGVDALLLPCEPQGLHSSQVRQLVALPPQSPLQPSSENSC